MKLYVIFLFIFFMVTYFQMLNNVAERHQQGLKDMHKQ